MAHSIEVRTEFLTAYKAYPGDNPNVQMIAKAVGIKQQTGSEWHRTIVETGTLPNTRPVTDADIQDYYDNVWKRDKEDTYAKLRSLNDKAIDKTMTLLNSDTCEGREFAQYMRGVEIGLRGMAGIRGETLGKIQVDHTHAHAHVHKHAVVVLPPIQRHDSLEDMESAYSQYQDQVKAIEQGSSDTPAE